jgi:hypothetical protein
MREQRTRDSKLESKKTVHEQMKLGAETLNANRIGTWQYAPISRIWDCLRGPMIESVLTIFVLAAALSMSAMARAQFDLGKLEY